MGVSIEDAVLYALRERSMAFSYSPRETPSSSRTPEEKKAIARELAKKCSTLAVLDARHPDEMLYSADGLPT